MSSFRLCFGAWLLALAPIAATAFAALPAQAKEIVVGQVAPFSGSQAVTGKAIHAGAKLYIDHVNGQGGINGQQIRLVTRDDAQKPQETVRLVKSLVQEEAPVALLGTVGTDNVKALIDDGVLVRSSLPLVGAVSGASAVIGAPAVFVVKASYHDEVSRLFEKLSNLTITRVGLVYQDDALGQDVLAGADKAAANRGIQLLAKVGYPRNTTEVSTAVIEMLKAEPQAIFLGATTAAAIEFVRQYRARGGLATIYGLSIIDTQQLLTQLGPETARGFAFSVVLPLESQHTLAVNREYLKLKAGAQNPDLSARSIEGFIAAKALVTALRQNSSAGNPLRALQSMRSQDLGGYMLDFGTPGRPGSALVDFAMIGSGGRIIH